MSLKAQIPSIQSSLEDYLTQEVRERGEGETEEKGVATYFGGRNLKRGKTMALDNNEIPKNIQDIFTFANLSSWIGKLNGLPWS